MKELMKRRENASDVKQCLENLNTLCEKAATTYSELLTLLPAEELIKQNEWFSSILKYSHTFQKDTEQWIIKAGQKTQQQKDSNGTQSCQTKEQTQIEDDINPDDSVSNVGSQKTTTSQYSSTSSSRLKAEAELAALTLRHKLLKEKHALEEEDQRLRKRKEELQLNAEIAEKMAKLEILKVNSTASGKSTSKVSDGMKSYFKKAQLSQQLNVDAEEFFPQRVETNPLPNTSVYK